VPSPALIFSVCIPKLNNQTFPCLIDSGASDTFIDSSIVCTNPLLRLLATPISLSLFDGEQSSAGHITFSFPHSIAFSSGARRSVNSLVTKLHPSVKLVLGHSWLQEENPIIDWQSQTLTLRPENVSEAASVPYVEPTDENLITQVHSSLTWGRTIFTKL
jgi:hypothetical protein